MAFRQCPRRLWLEVHHPSLRVDPPVTEAKFAVGDLVGALARVLYDPDENGVLVDVMGQGPEAAIAQTQNLMDKRVPVFEAGFEGAGARAFVDVLRPSKKAGQRAWELIEVKSSASLKGSHRDDVAIQAFVAQQAEVNLSAIKLAHIDTRFLYRGDDDYQGLLREVDLTDDALSRTDEVLDWVQAAHHIADQDTLPEVLIGGQCRSPYPCGFIKYCRTQETPVTFSIDLLPRVQGELKSWLQAHNIRDLKDVPDTQLTPLQQRVKSCTLTNTPYFDREGAQQDITALPVPYTFLDFEAVQLAVPIWPQTHPYQMFPFQFSLHVQEADGSLKHQDFIDLTGQEPSRAFAEALVNTCPRDGSIFVWNASFELTRLTVLAEQFPDLRSALLHIQKRMVDLLKIVERRYYHPDQKGSWKLKRVLPTFSTALNHGDLDGVKDGYMAVLAYIEAIQPETSIERRAQIRQELLSYCSLDTLALVTIAQALAGHPNPIVSPT